MLLIQEGIYRQFGLIQHQSQMKFMFVKEIEYCLSKPCRFSPHPALFQTNFHYKVNQVLPANRFATLHVQSSLDQRSVQDAVLLNSGKMLRLDIAHHSD
jgi:hypothetical protein